MAIVRVSAVASTVLAAAVSAVTPSVSASVGSISIAPYATPQVRMSVFVVPLTPLTSETVLPSDFRALDVTKVLVDVVTVTDTNNVSFDIGAAVVDSVAIVENSVKIFNGTVDFDPTDPDTDPDPINIADADAKTVGRPLTDAVTTADTNVKTTGKVSTDTVTASEAINTKDVGKTLTDSAAATEVITEFNTAKVVADSASITDAAAKELTRPDVADSIAATDDSFRAPALGKTDSVAAADTLNTFDIGTNPNETVSATDNNAKSIDKPLTDSVSITDVVVKTPAYVFDYDTLDADADPDPVTVADTQAFSVATSRSDSFTPADAINTLAVTKVLTDTATTSDVLVTNFIPGNTVPFVDFAFASDEKFTYSSVLGMLNAHLIHEPLVNGEFVLTTNPNAGIVYTIRTESEYTFAGYQVNGNQLN
jgi:hypothetical protein